MKLIIEEQKMFHKHLYTSKLNNTNTIHKVTNSFIQENDFPKLSDTDKINCDIPITIAECGKALQMLPNNKSPGSDGFTTNFYKFFWKDIKDLLFNSFESSFEKKLSTFQRMGILNLLPKKDKDLRSLANWRPVSLLNTDYKILTKLLAVRLQKVIPTIINSDQVGYIKNRYIGENVRILSDILLYTDLEDLEAYITQIDFEKAFDSVEWDFLFKTLKAVNFGENFIAWIKTLYTDIEACVGNNGNYSEYFVLSRSIRQGCPISALLFLLVVEMLANKIRNNTEIKGIKIDNEVFKIAMMADDITLINKDLQSISNAVKIFNNFEQCSGLKLNLSKTEIIPIGNQKNRDVQLPQELTKIKVKHGPFKALGVWFSNNLQETLTLNLTERIKSINTLINIWKSRKLSLKGKITILRTLILPQIQFLFSMIPIEESALKQLDTIFFKFLWNNKPAKIKRSTIIAPIEQGGLSMIDVYEVHATSKCSWICRLFNESESKWKLIFIKLLNIPKQMLNKNLEEQTANLCKGEFQKQVLMSWIKVHGNEPKLYKDVINQYLTYNKMIKINRKVITPGFFKANENGIRNIRILDMINPQNVFYTTPEFNNLNKTNLTQLDYNALKSSIPKKWKTIFIQNHNKVSIHPTEPSINIGNINKPISLIKSKDMYNNLILNKMKPPTSIDCWIDIYPFLETYDWKNIYSIPFKYVREPYLQSFQYKIINRILNTNEKLFKWSLKQSNMCNYCKAIDTIEHHLFQCNQSKNLWNKLETWIYQQLEVKLNLKECEVLFGLPNVTNNHIEPINFLIILTKWYINVQRSSDKQLFFIELLNIIREKVKLLILGNIMNNRNNTLWQDMLNEIL